MLWLHCWRDMTAGRTDDSSLIDSCIQLPKWTCLPIRQHLVLLRDWDGPVRGLILCQFWKHFCCWCEHMIWIIIRLRANYVKFSINCQGTHDFIWKNSWYFRVCDVLDSYTVIKDPSQCLIVGMSSFSTPLVLVSNRAPLDCFLPKILLYFLVSFKIPAELSKQHFHVCDRVYYGKLIESQKP